MNYLSLLDEVVQNLEHHPHQVRIKKLIFSVCTKKWNNDLNSLRNLSFNRLVQQLREMSPTIAHLKYIIYGIVIKLNKPTEYSLIGDIIVNEMEKLYSNYNESARQGASKDNNRVQHEKQQGKLVVLNLEVGNIDQGIKATVEIVEANNFIHTRVETWLPRVREILEQYDYWQSMYRSLDVNYRQGDPATRFTNISSVERIQQCFQAAELLRSSLHNWYKAAEYSLFGEKLQEEIDENEEIRIIIRTQNNRLWQLPWQLVFESFLNRYPKAEVVLSVPDRPATRSLTGSFVKILAILSNNTAINISEDLNQLSALPDSETLLLAAPNREQLDARLRQQDWSILFLSSYSYSQRETGRIYINETESLTIDELKFLLREAVGRGLKLAIFNLNEGLGLARELADLHLPQIVVMREPVPNAVAQQFLKLFLKAFSEGKSLYAAVRKARERLQPLEKVLPGVTWLPMICQNRPAIPQTWQEFRLPVKQQYKQQQSQQAEKLVTASTLLLNKADMPLAVPPPLESSPYETLHLANTLGGFSSEVYSLAISPDGQTLVSGSGDITHEDNTIKIWNLATGKQIRTLKGHHHWVNSLAISPDGQTIVSGSTDSTIKIWDLASGAITHPDIDCYHGVNSVAISRDGQRLACGCDDSSIKIWYMPVGIPKSNLTGHTRAVNSVAISPDGRKIVSGSDDRTIKIWDLATDTLINTLTAHSGRVFSVAISLDGQTLVSGSDDKTIKIWDLATGTCLSTLTGHDKAVNSVAITPDGQTIVSASLDKTIKIWDLHAGTSIDTLTAHDSAVLSVAISLDGQTIVTGSYGEIKIWRVSS